MPDFSVLVSDRDKIKQIEALYKTYYGDMIKLARSRLRREGFPNYHYDAQDAVHNVFLKLAKGIDRIDFNRSKSDIRLYLLKATVNAVNDLMSQRLFVKDIEECDGISDEDEFFEKLNMTERLDRVMKAIRELDEIYSITMLDFYKYQRSVKEIAASMGVPEKTVYTRLNRGRKLLIDLLEKEEKK